MKQFLLLPILLAAVASVRGASLVEGRIYLKNGSVIECVGDDRLQLPKRFGKLTILRDAFRKTKAKEIFQSGEIDSVVCWHAQSPEHIRKFIPAESPGWMWVYLETPHICVCIYSEKGYGIDSNGGIQVWQRQGTFSQSRTAYYLKKTGEKEFLTVGAANRNTKDVFRERIARYVGDDPELAERIRLSSAIRSKTIQLLRDSVVTLPNGIQLIGRDDRSNTARRSLQELMTGIDKSKPIILLDHQPYKLTESEAAGVDLQFSGHTHRGQVWPMNWVTDYIYEQSHGYRQWGNSHIYVSSGLSLWGPPFRIGTESDMAVFHLSTKK